MAELDSEDSSDGTLVIDEPNHDYETIVITDNSDVEIIDIIDNSSASNYPSSSTKSSLTCELCYRIFSTNNDLLNHISKFKGRIGGCKIETNINIISSIRETKSKNRTSKLKTKRVYKKKKSNSPKICSKLPPVPESIPLSCPQLLPIIFEPTSLTNDNYTNGNDTDKNLPSVRQMLVEEVDPEYPCTVCGQIFRHFIGLFCHSTSEHGKLSSDKVTNEGKSSTKSDEENQNVRNSVIKENKPIENYEPISNTVDLTLSLYPKKDSLINRMKSYMHSLNKDLVVCVLCNMEFKNKKKALSHIEDKHIMNKIECGYCNMKFVYELKLRSHMAKRHKVICVYKCDKCSKMINKEDCESHLKKCKGNPINIKSEEVCTL